MEPYVTAKHLAGLFGVEQTTINDWRKSLGMPSHRFAKGRRGGTVLFKMSEVEIWAERFKQQPKLRRFL